MFVPLIAIFSYVRMKLDLLQLHMLFVRTDEEVKKDDLNRGMGSKELVQL